ncbi:MAG: hypothetical protein JWO94_1481 [Verrucomicrobiaceae bacterium]|nr:hypothetical protein [Verrucomicrobiaceae bacterium]
MHILEHLGLALGLASIAGVNLYLTVLLTGLAVHFNLLHLAEQNQEFATLGHPWVLAVAGVLYALEFCADKVPWLDSAWDAVHTFIRPIGGALLGIQAMGSMPPHLQVIAGLLAGGAALTTHSAKAGTRLVINHSPEPASNIAMSLAEDIAVGGSTLLIFSHPVVALGLFSVTLVTLWFLVPKLFRLLRYSFRLIREKFRTLFKGSTPVTG